MDAMDATDPLDRTDPPYAGTERALLEAFLDYHRATLLAKVDGLDAEQLARTLPPSTMTLGGMLKHTASNEDYWFSHVFAGQEEAEPWASVDWTGDPDWDWRVGPDETPESVRALWETDVERGRRAIAGEDLDTTARGSTRSGVSPTLRWIVLHMIEEYARHNGHADLIRESVDGRTGE